MVGKEIYGTDKYDYGRSDRFPCTGCNKPTNHKSGKCNDCRTARCKKCNKVFTQSMNSQYCTAHRRHASKRISNDSHVPETLKE